MIAAMLCWWCYVPLSMIRTHSVWNPDQTMSTSHAPSDHAVRSASLAAIACSHHDMCSGMHAVIQNLTTFVKLVTAHPQQQDMHAGICEPDIWP